MHNTRRRYSKPVPSVSGIRLHIPRNSNGALSNISRTLPGCALAFEFRSDESVTLRDVTAARDLTPLRGNGALPARFVLTARHTRKPHQGNRSRWPAVQSAAPPNLRVSQSRRSGRAHQITSRE